MSSEEKVNSARHTITGARRIVVKVGSGILVNDDHHLDEERIEALVKDLSHLLANKIQLILVSSGAVAAGAPIMGLAEQDKTIPQKQACAALGQSRLMALYERLFSQHGYHTAQILLTQDDVRDRERYLNAKNTFETLLSSGILPVVNENDSVVVEEIKFGDNDNLSAQVSALVQADLLLMLSSIGGFYNKKLSEVEEDERPVAVIEQITEEHFQNAQDENTKNHITTGGMKSKLIAIQKAAHYGLPSILANGLREGIIQRILKGEQEGTLFLAEEESLSARKHWILHSLVPQGSLTVDDGALQAIVEQGKSLLPIGIMGVSGNFRSGNAVQILGPDNKEIARGLSNYDSNEVQIIKGQKSEKIESLLGYSYYDEVINRDDLVLVR
ncbi:MAG: glutamate 5-kinase [Acidobacteriota bacterium]|nr:glutamate 5-kinase [Acidobacteriota bacterium]